MARQPVDTGADFALDSEWVENAALVATIWEDRMWVHGGVLTRFGLGAGTTGLGETVAEAIVGAQFAPHREWTIDLGLGRGLTEGYGTSRVRIFAGLTFTRSPQPPPPAPVAFTPAAIESIPDEVVIEKLALPPPPPVELARVEQDKIVIRDPIQFELATDVILPVSAPTLQFVARLMAEHSDIAHLVIEGHASEEGSFYYNYDLAKRRADAIWRALVEGGVSPVRLSTRSMGEVEPIAAGAEEAQLAENRRVVFHIVKRLAIGELGVPYKLDILQPWTGNPQVLPAPPAPVPGVPPPTQVPEKDGPDRSDFEEDDEP
jgi:OOP family OmpA-OmpF porin